MSVFTKLVDRIFASTVAPATLPPFSSTTSPCTVPAVICDCAHPEDASPSARINTKNAHNNFLIFSPPDITTPISNEPKSSSKGRGGSQNNCCEEVYVETVPKHKCAACGNLSRCKSSFGWSQSVYRSAPSQNCSINVEVWRIVMSAIIAARGNRSRFSSRRGNDGGACRPLLRHAARRFWRRRHQGRKAGERRPIPQLGSTICGQRIRLLSRRKSQQTLHYAQLRSSARRRSIAETSGKRGRLYRQPTITRIAAKARYRSGIVVRKISAPHLLQHHRVRIHWPESRHAGLRHPGASGSRRDELHG